MLTTISTGIQLWLHITAHGSVPKGTLIARYTRKVFKVDYEMLFLTVTLDLFNSQKL